MSDLTPGPALDCDACGVTAVTEAERKREECPMCKEPATPVTITKCPAGDPDDCSDDDHDFGIDAHTTPYRGQ